MSNVYFNQHVHSQFSTLDGMSTIKALVERAEKYKQPGLGLTDHGLMAGTVQLYNSCKKHGIVPFPGEEWYIVDPKFDSAALGSDEINASERYHLIISALDLKGYQGLVKLSTLSFARPRFFKFPRLLVDDLVAFGKEYGEHVYVTTGCYFGLVQRTYWEQGWEATVRVAKQLQAVFPHLYVELHDHGIPNGYNEMGEPQLLDMLYNLSDNLGLPIIAGADTHYLEQKHKPAHSLMKAMGYNSKEDFFPGDTYHLPSTGWMKEKFSSDTFARIERSCAELLELNKLAIPQLDDFKVYVPEVSPTPDNELAVQCLRVLKEMFNGVDNFMDYLARMEEELRVIKITKTANYFLLVKQIVDHVRGQKIPIEARGSAGGSLVCFLLGITQIDPLLWGTTFDRFMSEDRVEPPDIDIDIADKYRHVVLDYLNNLEINGVRYKTSQIGTFSKFGQSDDDDNDTGSAFNKYVSYLKRQHLDAAWEEEKARAERAGKKPVRASADKIGGIKFNTSPDKNITKLEHVKSIHPEDYQGLKEIVEMNSVYNSRGTHAGGILISSQETSIEDFVPQMFIPKSGTDKDAGTWVTQYTMDDLKYLGLLKMDWLGQTSLSVMSKCMEFLDRDTQDFTWIPMDDVSVMNYLWTRKSHIGLFHLEKYPKSIAMTELKPKDVLNDFPIWQAFSMPGAVDSGAKDIYLNRRANKNYKPDYDHQLLHDVFDSTLGVMIYQEQVLDTCRGIGMNGAELTSFFKVVKDSGSGAVERNRERLNESKPRFSELATNTGLSEKETEWVWHQILAMGGYAFNKAHACAYGLRTYRTAYLKFHYPLEYMAALLYCWAGVKTHHNKRLKIYKDEAYLTEAHKMNLSILPVLVNRSYANWSIDKERKAIRKGFLSIKGIGPAVAPRIEANTPYTNVEDFCKRAKVAGSNPYLIALAKGKPLVYSSVLGTLNDLGCLDLIKGK